MKTPDLFDRLDILLLASLKAIAALTLFLFLASPAWTAQQLLQSEDVFGGRLINTSSTTAELALSTTTSPPINDRQNEICWISTGATTTQYVFIATFSTVAEDRYGWPVLSNGQKECHDFGPNIKLYVWHADEEASKAVRFFFAR